METVKLNELLNKKVEAGTINEEIKQWLLAPTTFNKDPKHVLSKYIDDGAHGDMPHWALTEEAVDFTWQSGKCISWTMETTRSTDDNKTVFELMTGVCPALKTGFFYDRWNLVTALGMIPRPVILRHMTELESAKTNFEFMVIVTKCYWGGFGHNGHFTHMEPVVDTETERARTMRRLLGAVSTHTHTVPSTSTANQRGLLGEMITRQHNK